MSKKSKKKPKKISAKKLKYAVFHKEKPEAPKIVTPDLSPEAQKNAQDDDLKIGMFLRQNRNKPTKEVNQRRMRSKR